MSKEEVVRDASSASTASPTPESKKPINGHAARFAKVYQFFGFSHWYNFPLWVIFAGGMLGFSLSRLPDLDYDGHFKNKFALVPGYWYYFGFGHYRWGMLIHLAAVLPAGILMVFQFTPVIRHKFIMFHRINGYIVLLLCLISNASAFVIIPHKQGGNRITSHAVEILMGIITTIGIFMAWWNVRRKQIDEHRAWMIRTMFYMGVTITARLINLAAGKIINRMGNYWSVWMCDEISFLYTNIGLPFPNATYPDCFLPDGTMDPWKRVAVAAIESHTNLEQLGSNAVAPFGTMLWLCLFMHVVGVEFYLRMTPKETERLRKVSYEKQLEAGFRNPGSAGTPLDRFSDADPWTPSK